VKGLSQVIDERFLSHRRRSTSTAGIAGAYVAVGLFWYRYFVEGIWSWDLLAVGMTVAAVKLSLMTWYYVKD
jgi:hypothetical protein